jgi:FAD dependent oxidoreductase TIGR03364
VPTLTRTIETDVCVVGAGLIGLAHALEARRRGLGVVVLERDVRAVGASVRQTGHLFFSALAAGDALEAAPPARARWLELMRRAGAVVDDTGTLIVARHRDELGVIEAAVADPARRARVLTAAEIETLAPLPSSRVVGGFYAPGDLRIDSRATTAALARLLTKDQHARIEWGAPVHEIEPGVVHAGALRVRAQAIVVCPGSGQRALPPALWSAQDRELTLCRTQMLRLAAPTGRRYRPTLSSGTSLLYHPAFATQPETEAVRARLELERPELVEGSVALVVAQLAGGDLVVGGTRTDAEAPPAPFMLERLYRLLVEELQELLGAVPEIRQRWQATQVCIRAEDDARDFFVSEPLPGVRIVQGVSGRDLALAHVRAAQVLDELLAPDDLARGFTNVRAAEFFLADKRGRDGVHAHSDAFRVRRVADA